MNNPEPTEPSVAPMTIVSAEQYMRLLWEATQAEKSEEPHVAPPGSEAVEDEVRRLEAVMDADLQRQVREKGDGFKVTFRALTAWRFTGAKISLWRVNGCVEGYCDDQECKEFHHQLKHAVLARDNDGTYTILDMEEIYDVSEAKENGVCFESASPRVVPIRLSDLMAEAAKQVVQAQEEAKQAKEDEDGDEELLARLKERRGPGPITRDPDPLEPEDTAQLPKIDMDQLHMVEKDEEDEEKAALPHWAVLELAKMDRDAQRCNGRLGWFWRAWYRLWRW